MTSPTYGPMGRDRFAYPYIFAKKPYIPCVFRLLDNKMITQSHPKFDKCLSVFYGTNSIPMVVPSSCTGDDVILWEIVYGKLLVAPKFRACLTPSSIGGGFALASLQACTKQSEMIITCKLPKQFTPLNYS